MFVNLGSWECEPYTRKCHGSARTGHNPREIANRSAFNAKFEYRRRSPTQGAARAQGLFAAPHDDLDRLADTDAAREIRDSLEETGRHFVILGHQEHAGPGNHVLAKDHADAKLFDAELAHFDGGGRIAKK